MTQDEIIRMAREAGFAEGVAEIVGLEGFERFAALVAAHEREKQAEQEPVDWTYTRKGIYDKLTELGASIVQSCCNVPDKRCGADEWILQTVQIELLLDALAAPVRTKDLTDEELNAMWYGNTKDGWLGLFRAVIAADRELNK